MKKSLLLLLALLFSVTIYAQDCITPTNLSAIVEEDVPGYGSKFRVTMTWDAVENATAYDVYVDGDRYGTTETNSLTAPAGAEGVIEFSVMTICQNGESELSEPYTVVIESNGEGCQTPVNFSNTIEKDLPGYDKKYKITINWDAIDGAESYSVYFYNKDYNGMWLGDVYTNEFVQGFNVDESTVYAFYITVVTHCSGGTVSLESEPHQVVINGDLPDAPANLVTEIEQNVEGYEYNFRVTLSWEGLVNADEYYIYLDGKYVESTTETSYVMGFNEVGEHYFTIKTISDGIESLHSEKAYFSLVNTSVNEQELAFEIYPNPVENNLYINAQERINEINIYNIMGINVRNEQCTMNNVQLNVSDLNSGIYFVKIMTDKGETVKRFIKD